MKYDLTKMRKKVKHELDPARYQHTLGVMYTSASLAMSHGANLEKAMVAGLLHDCAKCIPNDEKYQLCEKYHLEITDAEQANPSLLHAPLGACLAKKKYGVKDPEILNAIRYHTTGRPDMSLLEKIVYTADYIEPWREELPNMEEVRRLAFRDLDQALICMLEGSLEYLNSRNVTIDPMTQETYDYYTQQPSD